LFLFKANKFIPLRLYKAAVYDMNDKSIGLREVSEEQGLNLEEVERIYMAKQGNLKENDLLEDFGVV
jgi:hypothetical protein